MNMDSFPGIFGALGSDNSARRLPSLLDSPSFLADEGEILILYVGIIFSIKWGVVFLCGSPSAV
jgi:hypothetical protein